MPRFRQWAPGWAGVGLSCFLLSSGAAGAEDGAQESHVLATFRGGQLTVADMQQAIATKAWTTRVRAASPEGRRDFLRQMVSFDLLVLEAERRGYAEHPAVELAVKEATVAAMQVKDLDRGAAAVPADDLERAFEEQKARLTKAPLRRASHIQVATEAEAQALIKELARADAMRFAAAARERSTDEPTRRQGGELGHFDEQGRIDTSERSISLELARAAFAQKVGSVSRRPIAHAGGFSVLLVTGEQPGFVPARAELELELREQLRKERVTRSYDELVQALRASTKLELRPELVDGVALEPAPASDMPQGFPAAPPDPREPDQVVEPDGA